MKRNFISVLLIIVMVVISACAGANFLSPTGATRLETNDKASNEKVAADSVLMPIEKTWVAETTGVIFTKNERLMNSEGGIFKYDHGEFVPGSGLIAFAAMYAAVDKANYKVLSENIADVLDKDGTYNDVKDLADGFYNHITPLFTVYAVNNGNTLIDLRQKLSKFLDGEKELNEFFTQNSVTPIGSIDGWHYFYTYQKPEYVSYDELKKIGDFQDDFMDLLTHADEYKDSIKLKAPMIGASKN